MGSNKLYRRGGIGGKSKNLKEGVKIAKTLLQSGEVANLFDKYIETTIRLADE